MSATLAVPPPSVINAPDLRNRRGKLRCSRKWIDRVLEGSHEALAAHAATFSGFVIVRAEMSFMEDAVKYEGYHPLFAEIDEHLDAPEYRTEISRTTDEHNITTFTCKMVPVK